MIFNGFPSGIGPFCARNGSLSGAGTLRKLLFGVAQAHMKAKDTSEAIETLDKTIGLAQAAGDMQDVHVTKGDLEGVFNGFKESCEESNGFFFTRLCSMFLSLT